jgi:DNA-directed RNA polymerase subunit RPC12/RpoP
MKGPVSLSELEDFARQSIASQNHPEDYHNFSLYTCSSCKSSAFKLTIEHHSGTEEWSFKGIIWGECADCGYLGRLFTFTGSHREKLRDERPVCECGSRIFVAGQCERIEGEQGIPGFFDEGVVVGKCINCKRNQVFVFTD